jgi:glutathione S-transferase
VIYHLALRSEWDASTDRYARSTIDQSLAEVGFIHCSYASQVQGTADLFYRDRDDVVLLTIDPELVDAEIRVEGGFPHIYGPLPVAAVVRTDPLARGADGRLQIP